MTTKKCKSDSLTLPTTYWSILIGLNILVIIIRLTLRTEKNVVNLKLFYFIAWLELQFIGFYILLITVYIFFWVVAKIVILIKDIIVSLAAKRKTNRFMKWLKMTTADLYLFRLYCIIYIIVLSVLLCFIVYNYQKFFLFCMGFLLGYTQI